MDLISLDDHRRSEQGQFVTSAPIARFMAGLFEADEGHIAVLRLQLVHVRCGDLHPPLVERLHHVGRFGVGMIGEILSDLGCFAVSGHWWFSPLVSIAMIGEGPNVKLALHT